MTRCSVGALLARESSDEVNQIDRVIAYREQARLLQIIVVSGRFYLGAAGANPYEFQIMMNLWEILWL
ncbi:hypothetical protein AO242_28240 [Pseudomonas sp. ICMP 561]|nr:hypothetical protein AO242_28240 [Pseudomonas sp. ICMP 561]